jgi:excinuclease ABC subunit A
VERWRDSLETAFEYGQGRCTLFLSSPPEDRPSPDAPPDAFDSVHSAAAPAPPAEVEPRLTSAEAARACLLDGQTWWRRDFAAHLACQRCGRTYPEPEPRLFSFNHPLGACPRCEGFGDTLEFDPQLIVPHPGKTIRRGALAPWNSPAYKHELQALLAEAGRLGLRVDVPYAELSDRERELIWNGGDGFSGLRGFFAGLERRAYKVHVRAYINRFRRPQVCSACQGSRLCPEALAVKVGGRSIAEVCTLTVSGARTFFRDLVLSEWEERVARPMLAQIQSRLQFLEDVGLGYLTLDRALHTLSGGEAQRAALTTALGSSLVNVLYVLDEPTVGLHPVDSQRLLSAVRRLCQRGNTVMVVEHDESFVRAADHVVEIGPGAGQHGGRVVFQGTPTEMLESGASLTGDYLSGRRAIRPPSRRRAAEHGEIRLRGARGHNLRGIDVGFPLGMLCVVTGVSGSGKSTLVADTLYPAVCRQLRKAAPPAAPYDDVLGAGQVDDCVLVDQTPLGRTARSNPVTYVKAFDEIRQVFASTVTARTRNYPASFFSFNVEGGRCPACEGQGQVAVDMQFLADVYVTCSECQGLRYRPEVLDVTYRGCSIAEVLEMTARQAHVFFRGQPRVQARLKRLIDVGLDYLRLGQPAATLSGGEAQRLKLAGYLSEVRRGRTLILLDEPTTGLHPADIVNLLDCFEALLAAGHSLIVVEHNLHLIACADYVIDLGPGAAAEGGRVVAAGTPEQVAATPDSATGRLLAQTLAAARCEQPA